jgi:transposase
MAPYPNCRTKKNAINWKGKGGFIMGQKKRQAPPRYDSAFKEGAIKLVTEGGRPARDVASELGISIDTLRNWLKAAGLSPKTVGQDNRQAARMRELEGEIKKLRRELAEKQEVIDVLKKSVGILSTP